MQSMNILKRNKEKNRARSRGDHALTLAPIEGALKPDALSFYFSLCSIVLAFANILAAIILSKSLAAIKEIIEVQTLHFHEGQWRQQDPSQWNLLSYSLSSPWLVLQSFLSFKLTWSYMMRYHVYPIYVCSRHFCMDIKTN